MLRRPLPLLILLVTIGFAAESKPTPKTLSLQASLDSGTVVYLSDASAWEIRPENRPRVAAWSHKIPVAVYRNGDAVWPYVLILRPGHPTGEVVGARRLVQIK